MNLQRLLAAFGLVTLIALWGSANAAGSPGAAEAPGPLSPAASLACFGVVPGHVVELVAAEPLVFDPVAIGDLLDHSPSLAAEIGDALESRRRAAQAARRGT